MPNELAANTTMPAKTLKEPQVMAMKQTPLKAQKPAEEEVGVAEVFEAPPPAERKPAPGMQMAANMPKKLPKTASEYVGKVISDQSG